MQIQSLNLLNFRNYEKASITFDKHLNVIYGKNGSGKTNLVEAIYVLALTRSFRQVSDRTLIRSNTNLTKISGVLNNQYQNKYKVIITPDGKKVKIDEAKITKISDYISKINIVLFNPTDLKMVKDTPSIRRKYLNIAISQHNLLYLKYLNDYNKLIKRRNAYLKQMYTNGNSIGKYLDIITEKMVDVGLNIYKIREQYLEDVNKYISTIYERIAEKGYLKIVYVSDYLNKSKDDLKLMYKNSLKKDLAFGKTNLGVHHDDILFYLDDSEIKDYGSEGQQKNAVIAWKFSELTILKKIKGENPILILDDLLSELDTEKIQNILNLIESDVQTFITTTEIDKVKNLLKKEDYKKIQVINGVLKEE